MKKIVNVAAAVILRSDGAFLLGRRPPGSVYAGYWEFPGGKVEVGETPRDALARELHEELGIVVETAYPWIVREFVYQHAHVRLHFFRVLRWSGELRDLQHDALEWQYAQQVRVTPMLPANAPVLAALSLPDFYAISHAAAIGVEAQIVALQRALERGLRLLQLREPDLPAVQKAAFYHAAVALCHRFQARVLINSEANLAQQSGADGLHLTAAQLMALESRPDFPLVAASCHNAQDLAQAARCGLDFVVLGPVKETLSHPGRTGIGWQACAQLIADTPLPVYAIGGLTAADMQYAWRAGAHGIAAIRAAWQA
ncbi:MAG: Nudix family hydrolase [Betaproteobacteria bacterium]|nr:Nudix family hydrolase [Betaproteobacteria bacterium]